MIDPDRLKNRALLSLVAAAKAAVASTLARAVAALGGNPQNALPSLPLAERFDYRSAVSETDMAGRDAISEPLDAAVQCLGIAPDRRCDHYAEELQPIFI